MPLDYMTNTYVDLREDVINQLSNPDSGVTDDNIDMYIESKGYNPEEFREESNNEYI